jgi:hypothetical protein
LAKENNMRNQLRTVLAGPCLALCVVGLMGAATACSGNIETQDTKPSSSSSGTGGGSSIGSLTPQPAVNESSPNVSGRASSAASDGAQTADGIAASPRASSGGSRSRRVRDNRVDAGVAADAGVEADAGIEVDGGVALDAGANDAGAANAAP